MISRRETVHSNFTSGINTIYATDRHVGPKTQFIEVPKPNILSGQFKEHYLKPDFALGFPLTFLLSAGALVPNSPRSGWDIV